MITYFEIVLFPHKVHGLKVVLLVPSKTFSVVQPAHGHRQTLAIALDLPPLLVDGFSKRLPTFGISLQFQELIITEKI